MRKILITFLILCVSGMIYGQSSVHKTPDTRLYQVFDKGHITFLQEKNPDLIIYYNYFLDHSYFIMELESDKLNSQNFPQIQLEKGESSKRLNILRYDLKRDFDKYMHYQISGTNLVIVMFPEKEFMEKFNEFKNNN